MTVAMCSRWECGGLQGEKNKGGEEEWTNGEEEKVALFYRLLRGKLRGKTTIFSTGRAPGWR